MDIWARTCNTFITVYMLLQDDDAIHKDACKECLSHIGASSILILSSGNGGKLHFCLD